MATGTGCGRGNIHYGDELAVLDGLLIDDKTPKSIITDMDSGYVKGMYKKVDSGVDDLAEGRMPLDGIWSRLMSDIR